MIIAALYHTQIYHNKDLRSLAAQNFTRRYPIEPIRGNIYDRLRRPLALNRFAFHAFLSTNHAFHPQSLKIINKCLVQNEELKSLIFNNIKKGIQFCLKKNITATEVACLRSQQCQKFGISIQRSNIRHYPISTLTKRIIGQTSYPNKEDFTEKKLPPHYLSLPLGLIGHSGLEATHDQALRGTCGHLQRKINAQGIFIKDLESLPPQNGEHIFTTLNADLQKKVESVLLTVPAAHAVVMHIPTGQILAMVSHDQQDNNMKGASNRVISGLFPPGSIFKIVAAYAALAKGESSFSVFCDGAFKLGNCTLHCWQNTGHQHTDLNKAIQQSCNIFFYQLGLKIGSSAVIAAAKKLGLGSLTHVDLPYEVSGILPHHNPKTYTPYQPWYGADSAMLAIGQGRIALTPLQLTQMMANILRGYSVPPSVLLYKNPPAKVDLGITPAIRNTLRLMLHHTINQEHGTGYKARIKNDKMLMGGKTSTAQVAHVQKEKKQSMLPYALRSHSIFTGFAPTNQPLLAITVIGEHELWGSGFAAHAAKEILQHALTLHEKGQLLAHA
ncbi:MAG: penicillin-binding transpeptidase domain-containing protein [Alphaproteobacteria bacterium]|nr:penicillin-binding transpeptidase domain-containing protein [Alphaproteobacteria bacterium]